mmetsp:Transcript_27794/g.88366  ORF Transcript_27794/g.88366 Transcript_27794/m.88366 type:complete len:213 (-) Transcript_27794:47-685(-)
MWGDVDLPSSLVPSTRMRHRERDVGEEGRAGRAGAKPPDRGVGEQVGRVIVRVRPGHAQAARPRLVVERKRLHPAADGPFGRIHVVTVQLRGLPGEPAEPEIERRATPLDDRRQARRRHDVHRCRLSKGDRLVARRLQQLRQERPVGRRSRQPARVSSCEEGRTRGSANSVASVSRSEAHASSSESVEIWRAKQAWRGEGGLSRTKVVGHQP